jgi:hypothetical protein
MRFKTRFIVLGLVWAALCGAEPLGTLERFWRHHPVVDRWMAGGAGLQEIPDWLCDPALSFPYRKKDQPKQIPFCDHVTAVRLLGGWHPDWKNGEVRPGTEAADYDLAYRDESGEIRYRWPLLFSRLNPYVNAGCGLTLVLDNTPACFAAEASWKSMGQAAPPGDLNEWGAFIEELCRQLVEEYGAERVNGWRFRLGTECQGDERFDGTQEQFHRFYAATASAVRRVLPEAPFGPFNLAGTYDGSDGTLSYLDLADFCISNSLPLDFAAVSIYTAPSVLKGSLRTTNPRFKARQKVEFWNALGGRHEPLRNIPREVQEFGILGNEFGIGSGEPGARGAAWNFDMMVSLLDGGMDRFWFWDVFDYIPHGRIDYLLNGTGWLFSVLEHAAGGEVSAIEPEVIPQPDARYPPALQPVASFEREQPLRHSGQLFVRSLMVEKPDRVFLITSVFHEDRFVCEPQDITLTLPEALVGSGAVIRQAALDRTNSVHWLAREDLDAAGLLDPKFAAVPGLLGPLMQLGGPAARRHVGQNWTKYEAHMKELLTLRPFGGRVRSEEGRLRVTFEAAPPSVTVLVIEKPHG